MPQYKEQDEVIFSSPLNLLYSAWSDQQLTVSHRSAEHYAKLDRLLRPLPEPARHQIYQTICQVVTENERVAFLEGVRTGASLAAEIAG